MRASTYHVTAIRVSGAGEARPWRGAGGQHSAVERPQAQRAGPSLGLLGPSLLLLASDS
jgi:hypothetical protein